MILDWRPLLKQFTELHVVSALLFPSNYAIQLVGLSAENAFNPIMYRFFTKYLPNEEEAALATKQWLEYCHQEHAFHSKSECWNFINNPELFWSYSKSFALVLSTIALQVVKIPGNSVLAKRSWSIMNLILSKTRNSIKSDNVDKLMYIHMNERALNRPFDLKSKLQYAGLDFDEAGLCEMEDRLIQEEVGLSQQSEEVDVSEPPRASHKQAASSQLDNEARRHWIER